MIHILQGKYFSNPILIYGQISKANVSTHITDGYKSKRLYLLLKVFRRQPPIVLDNRADRSKGYPYSEAHIQYSQGPSMLHVLQKQDFYKCILPAEQVGGL